MATRARIGIELDGKIVGAYQHWDGYPGGLGYNLIDHWYRADKIVEGIKLGDSSKWGYIVGNMVDFDDRNDPMHDVQNVYYSRDRGENAPFKVYDNEEDYLNRGFNAGEEYVYLAKREGKKDYSGNEEVTWYYASFENKKFKPLEEVAINDHIAMLKRHLEMIKNKEAA